MRSLKLQCAAILIAVIFVGCANKPPQTAALSFNANPAVEIEKTDAMMKEAYDHQIDVLAPENFTDAKKALDKAKILREKGKSNDEVLTQISYAQGWLKEATDKAELIKTSMKSVTDARAGALHAGASELYPKEWKKTEAELESISTAGEKGNLSPAEKKGDFITARYRELEVMSVTKTYLGKADDNIRLARLNGAEKKAPKSYTVAVLKYENAEKMIIADPRNTEAIKRASDDAVRESMHLENVTRKVNAGNTEDLVLMNERQQRTITNLQSEQTSSEEELQQSQEQLTKAEQERQALARRQASLERAKKASDVADHLRRQFKSNEADVYTENGKVMVRLKALQFASNQTTLNPKSRSFLNKVGTALNSIDASALTIEGHTDSTGNPQTNKTLSAKRAEAVEKFLVSKGTVPEDRVNAVGMGPEEPISDNSTAQGRALNRRIDLIIETE
ncbi:MAG: OmpA family protein [Pseudobdellovibrionaceae bacterium]